MKLNQRFLVLFALLLLVGTPAFAQGTTGQLTGTVLNQGTALPGVTVTATSPNLQGTRVDYTDVNGNYTIGALPPGEYTVRLEMESMQTQTRTAKIGVGQTARVDASIGLSSVAEAITVTANAPAALETTQVQANFTGEFIEKLPSGRTLLATTSLAPGVNNNGPGRTVTISGSYAYDNLYLVNGVPVVENLRGQPHNLFIEDAIQETTVFTAGAISAEFGRFSGGVVSAITKSGGNDFSGSLRDSLTNDAWTELSPFRNPTTGAPQTDPVSKLNSVYEGTLGGRVIRDRLWFFLAGRQFESETQQTFSRTTATYTRGDESFRKEAKLTGQITQKHSLVGSYLDAGTKQTNNCQIGCLDLSAVDASVENPNIFETVQYNGIITSNFIVEASYSNKEFAFIGFGGDDGDRINGTVVRDFSSTGGGGNFNAPYFSGLNPESRDSQQLGVKGTYYLGTSNLGTHNFTLGYDGWQESRVSNNFQSASNFVVYLSGIPPQRDANGVVGNITFSEGDAIGYWPVLQSSLGSDGKSHAAYINDKWDFNKNFSFNIGARLDKLDASDSAGNKTSDDSAISPRIGAIYDIFGNGKLRLNGSYSKYVSRLAENAFGAGSIAGNPALFYYEYAGPDIGPLPTRQALAQLFAWFDSKGGVNGIKDPNILTFIRVPGATSVVGDDLKSPSVDEFTFGVGTQIGSRAFVRADYIDRDWKDFYTVKRDRETGTVVANSATGQLADKAVTYNSDLFERTYKAVQLQAQYRLFERLNFGGNYTWSELKGNITGETAGSGPISDASYTYPEYTGFAQSNPIGFLGADQTHRVRAYMSYDQPTPIGTFNVSVLQRFDSGTPYSVAGSIDVRRSATRLPNGIVNTFGYAAPPSSVTYFFSERGEFRFDDETATDLAINYTLPISRLGLFIQADLLNAFDEDAQIAGDTSVITGNVTTCIQTVGPKADGKTRCDLFNPFTTTPVRNSLSERPHLR